MKKKVSERASFFVFILNTFSALTNLVCLNKLFCVHFEHICQKSKISFKYCSCFFVGGVLYYKKKEKEEVSHCEKLRVKRESY